MYHILLICLPWTTMDAPLSLPRTTMDASLCLPWTTMYEGCSKSFANRYTENTQSIGI